MRTLACHGSLRKDFRLHQYYLEDARALGTSHIDGAMYLVGDTYPHLLAPEHVSDETLIRSHLVELYEVDDTVFDSIERMEHSAGYYTKQMPFTLEDGSVVEAAIFLTRPTVPMTGHTWVPEYSKETAPGGYAG